MNEEKKILIYKKKRVLCWAKMIDNFFFPSHQTHVLYNTYKLYIW